MIMLCKRSSVKTFAVILLMAGITAGIAVKYVPYLQVMKTSGSDDVKIIVDAGHGSPDGGAVGKNGTQEKDINLAIALKLTEVLEHKGMKVVMTRSEDKALYDDESMSIREKKRADMKNRLDIMKKSNADLFISIHMNSFSDSSAKGLHLFYDKSHKDIKELAEKVQSEMGEITGAQMHLVKAADSRLFLMKNPPLPSLLIECGFLSNPDEEKKLNTEEYQAKIAWAIGEALEEYYMKNNTPTPD